MMSGIAQWFWFSIPHLLKGLEKWSTLSEVWTFAATATVVVEWIPSTHRGQAGYVQFVWVISWYKHILWHSNGISQPILGWIAAYFVGKTGDSTMTLQRYFGLVLLSVQSFHCKVAPKRTWGGFNSLNTSLIMQQQSHQTPHSVMAFQFFLVFPQIFILERILLSLHCSVLDTSSWI